ncbi:Uncharacterised protein [Mycobacterium tuberculosis]|uniref:Uncharacterized protein n=2 Tax=Mycobacterium tuberculosis TaxID=1773 RepID=A0A0U0QPG5_MYCTX|nr:Uncharacterised protein [Mycobacterium tuberculosis]
MRASRSTALASRPTTTRAWPLATPLTMVLAAISGECSASRRSKNSANVCWSSPSATVALRATAVLMPPGCTHVTLTGCLATSISWRSASVKPRTANLAAL